MLIAGIIVAAVVAFFEFWYNFRYNYEATPSQSVVNNKYNQDGILESERNYTPPDRSFWIEIAEELRYASWCMNKQKRPALTRTCSKCTIPKGQRITKL